MSFFTVVAYSSDALGNALVQGSHEQNEDVRHKSHATYLDGYLKEIGAQTIVVEDGYIDRDFLEDFAAYHVRCFADYSRKCSRLHFFNYDFDAAKFDNYLLRIDPLDELKTGYLGFIVVKPLPETVIGRTCLATYSTNPTTHQRFFPTVRPERANIFGIELVVPSLPFQQQDKDVAACASSALWTVLNGTGKIFQHAIPSPVEITRAAGVHTRSHNRMFPAGDGLSSNQMADAIRGMNLEPHALGVDDPAVLKIATLAYLRLGIPALLMGSLYREAPGQQAAFVGGHAIAITGYGLPTGVSGGSYGSSGQQFKAVAIDRLYCHDDQVGPFSKLEFDTAALPPSGTGSAFVTRRVLTRKAPRAGRWIWRPITFMVPLYHKIRIPISGVIQATHKTDSFLEQIRAVGALPLRERIVWDLRLTTVNELRDDIAKSSIDEISKRRLLLRSYPKFLWRIEAASAGVPLFDALFDATDLLQAKYLVDVIPYEAIACQAITAALAPAASMIANDPRLNRSILHWFSQSGQFSP